MGGTSEEQVQFRGPHEQPVLETKLRSTGVTCKSTISTGHDGSRWKDDLISTPLHALIEKEVSGSRGENDVTQKAQKVSETNSRNDSSGECSEQK